MWKRFVLAAFISSFRICTNNANVTLLKLRLRLMEGNLVEKTNKWFVSHSFFEVHTCRIVLIIVKKRDEFIFLDFLGDVIMDNPQNTFFVFEDVGEHRPLTVPPRRVYFTREVCWSTKWFIHSKGSRVCAWLDFEIHTQEENLSWNHFFWFGVISRVCESRTCTFSS